MYYKIINVGDPENKYVNMGMINIDAAMYLESGDEGYDKYIEEHYIDIPIMPETGYPGKVDEENLPVDIDDYEKWMQSLPTTKYLKPFVTHSIQFENDVTEEEIKYCFDVAIILSHKNYLKDDLLCEKVGIKVNQPFFYKERKSYYEGIKSLQEKDKTEIIKKAENKIVLANGRINNLKNSLITKTLNKNNKAK